MSNETQLDYYQVLGVAPNVKPDALRKAYKKLCQKYHPDKSENNAEHFARIRKAYDTLSDPRKRAIYDQGLKQGINPEEFKTILRAMCNAIIIKTFERLSQRRDGNFLREAHRALSTEKAALVLKIAEISEQYGMVMMHVKSIQKGQNAHLAQAAIKKATELKVALDSGAVAIAVMDYLMEDTEQIVCPENQAERYPVLGVTRFTDTGRWTA